ncbi:MAG: sensor histidine kinase, partial [Bacillales bacterium]|nr:sensor histidine kinase [Bacillales bacterium]
HKDQHLSGSYTYDTFEIHKTNYVIKYFLGVRSIISITPITFYNSSWSLLTIQAYNDVFNSIIVLQVLVIVLAVVFFIITAIFITFKVSKIVKPIKELSTALINDEYPAIQSKDEIYLLELSYKNMKERINNLFLQIEGNEEIKRQLELDTLQNQINPHFLYKTLDSIAWLAKIKKEEEIETVIVALANFFRSTLHKGAKFVAVEEELMIIKSYLEIEKFRYPNKFEIVYAISEDVKYETTLKLILQPIVENCIKHGLALKDKGEISIMCYVEKNDIFFEVADNGVGFVVPDDLLLMNEEKKNSKGGYGLINVNERIKLEYGSDYGIFVTSEVNKGTNVVIKIKKKD